MTKVLEKALFQSKLDKDLDKIDKDYYQNNDKVTQDGARIISSGKIYRHLFDSEVQLIKALERYKTEKLKQIDVMLLVSPEKKKYQKYKVLPNIEKQVSLLPENVTSNKNKSEVIPQILESRKQKFEGYVNEVEETFGNINYETNAKMTEVCRDLNVEFIQLKEKTEESISDLNSRDVMALSRKDFDDFEDKMREYQIEQQISVDQFYSKISQLENERVKKIQKYLTLSSSELERIGHVPPTEVHRLILSIISDFNLDLLKNRETYLDMKTKLLMVSIYDNRKRQIYLQNKITDWRAVVSQFYLQNIKDRIVTDQQNVDNIVDRYMSQYNSELDKLNEEMMLILENIETNMSPEYVSETVLHQWITNLKALKENYDQTCDKFIKDFTVSVENTHTNYLAELNETKAIMLEKHLYNTEDECMSEVDKTLLPIIGSLHQTLESEVNAYELIFDAVNKQLEENMFKLNKIIESLLMLWTNHNESLDRIEETIGQKLSVNRENHEELNVNLENDLNVLIDEMRQNSSESALKDSLKKSIGMLDKIKNSYHQFNNQQMSILRKYPSLIEAEVTKYGNCLKKNFTDQNLFIETALEELSNRDSGKGVDKKPIRTLEFSLSRILDLWKRTDKFYETFIKDWEVKVQRNGKKMIAAKSEELESELKLRLHLHEPRYRRIQFDVHNVRVTELTIHVERVTRQIKYVERLLANIKDEYTSMDKEQKSKQEEFKEHFLALDQSALDVSSQSKLQNIRRKLDYETTAYMKELRTKLFEFRKNGEDRLQDIRRSNADFVCTFKLFSDGGNFCPEEIDSFIKRIETVNQKVDDVEGEIMSNLELVEKNENDFVTQLKMNFEDKFKHHVTDIGFLEKLTRAMADLMVKIKSEVENSNSQSRHLVEQMQKLYQNMKLTSDAIETNQECVDPVIFQNILKLFSALNDRSIYLECLRPQQNPGMNQPNLAAGGDQAATATNQTSQKVRFPVGVTPVSKSGKQACDDNGLKAVKEILQSQNEYLTNVTPKLDISKKGDKDGPSRDADRNSNIMSSKRNSLVAEAANIGKVGEKTKISSKAQLQEKKMSLFNESDNSASTPPVTFLGKVRESCKTVLDGILFAAEIYYRHKGGRKVTQADLEETLEAAADTVVAKIKGYYQQVEQNRVACIKEFVKQLLEVERITNMFPQRVYSTLFSKSVNQLNRTLQLHDAETEKLFQALNEKKSENRSKLRPDLGHPNCADKLTELCESENERLQQEQEVIDNYVKMRRQLIYGEGQQFIKDVTCVTEQLFLLMDNMLTSADVLNFEEKDKYQNVVSLIRDQMQQNYREYTFELDANGRGTWITKDLRDIIKAEDDQCEQTEKGMGDFFLITSKSTTCHFSVIKQRSEAVEKFKEEYFKTLQNTEEINRKKQSDCQKNNIYWKNSVDELVQINNNN